MTQTETKYIITREQCQKNIDASKHVCSGCGGEIEPIETVDNADRPTFWPGCLKCSVYEYGVPKDIYETAKDLVLNDYHIQYSHLGNSYGKTGEELQRWQRSQIRGTSGLVNKVLRVYNEIAKQPSQL